MLVPWYTAELILVLWGGGLWDIHRPPSKNLGLAESLQPQLALEIVIQVGSECCVYPVQGGQSRVTDLIGAGKGG